MAIGGRGGVTVHVDEAVLYNLLESPEGPVARWMQNKVVEPITQEAKRLAPVSFQGSTSLAHNMVGELEEYHRPSGYMKSQIGWTHGRDAEGMYWDINSPATSTQGAPYGLFVEIGTKEHDIESKGPWPLRNRQTGAVFGHKVKHPGTAPQPYLRPALWNVLAGLSSGPSVNLVAWGA